MVQARIDIVGLDKQINTLRAQAPRGKDAVFQWVARVAFKTQQRAVQGIQRGPKSGRIYQKYQPRRIHRASAPGQYPASDTGRLASSIGVEPPSNRENPVARVGTAVRYGAYLERKSSARGGRPWLARSLREALAELNSTLGRELK